MQRVDTKRWDFAGHELKDGNHHQYRVLGLTEDGKEWLVQYDNLNDMSRKPQFAVYQDYIRLLHSQITILEDACEDWKQKYEGGES